MANTVNYASKYLSMLDRIYKTNGVTSILEAAGSKYRLSSENEKTVYLRKMSLQGLGAYSRADGYDSGDATIEWEAHTFAQDRSKKFNLDAMDSKEAYTTIAEIGAEFQRNHVVPEVDAYRFEKICNLCGLDVSANLDGDSVMAAISTGIKTLDDAEVPRENRLMFVSSTTEKNMEDSGEFFKTISVQSNNGNVNTKITTYNDMPIIPVPAARFHNNFDFAASGAGGFAAAGGSKALNFMILSLEAIIAIIKHVAPKVIMPEFNTDYDGWLYCYRIYHDLFIPENKVGGVYVHSIA